MGELHPQMQAIIDAMEEAGGPAFEDISAAEARANLDARDGDYYLQPPEVAGVSERTIPGPAGPIPVRVYTPLHVPADPAPPLIVLYHGGGWVVGSFASHDPECRAMANSAGAVVMAVDYRLAPEHKFPAAVDDCWAACRWATENAGEIGADPSRIAITGDSAGGNLAAVIAQIAAREGAPKIALQVLIYPVTHAATETDSYQRYAEGHVLTRAGMQYFIATYLNDAAEANDPRVSPLLATDVSGAAPALVVTASHDPLHDEGKAYADKLSAAGVPVEYVCYDGMTHGFHLWSAGLDAARDLKARSAAALKRAFGTM
jgi:acetyl esterase